MAVDKVAVKKAALRDVNRAIAGHPRVLAKRDRLVKELYALGVPRPELAKLAGLTPGRISQIAGAPNGNR